MLRHLVLQYLLVGCFAWGIHAVPLTATNTEVASEPTPVVLWHGMGDTCCLPFSMGAIKKILEDKIDGVYVRSLMFGKNEAQDQRSGFFMPILEQLDFACDVIRQDPKLAGGFHAIGFSQGGLFLRLLVQTCDIKMKNLISIGGPQQGVYGFPQCTEPAALCLEMDRLLELGAYLPLVQYRLVQAQYWHDPLDHKRYVADNIALPLLNNEKEVNATYAQRLQTLDNFVMVKFENDTVVIPRESEWFGFYVDGQSKELETLQESALYTEDRLGLKKLDTSGRLHLLQCEGNHLDMPHGFFEGRIIPFLNGSPTPTWTSGLPVAVALASEAEKKAKTQPKADGGAVGGW